MFFTLVTAAIWMILPLYAACAGTVTTDPDMVVKILYDDRDTAYDLLQPLRLTYEDVQPTWARALAKMNQLIKIREMGFEVEVLWEDAARRAAFKKEAMGERWTSYSSVVSTMQSIASSYPDIVRLHNIGQTVQSRTIWVMEITDNPDEDETDEPEVRMVGNIHGDEYMSLEIMRLLMDYLTSNYGTDPDVTDLVNNREIWIQPSVNPDGHENGSRYNANGVDMNRNHGYMWATGGGSYAFSEPELQHFREYSLQRNFSTSLTFHGEAEYYNYTWNFTGENCADKTMLIDWGNTYVIDNDYTVIEGWDWYQTNGDTNDWSYGCRGSMDVTIETPHYSEGYIQSEFDENINGILYFIEVAGYGISGVVSDSTGNPLEATVLVNERPMVVYTDPVAGDYHRPLQAGTYSITVWANGFTPQTITGITVANQATTAVDVVLTPSYTHHALQTAWTQIDDYYESNSASWADYMWPHNALGPADNVPGSLGRGCIVVYDMGTGFDIIDQPGNDFMVTEAASAGDGDEQCAVYGSSGNFLGPWVLIGNTVGTTEFDLSGTGLTSVRYLKFIDDGDGSATGNYPGYDLDAISTINVPEGCGVVSMDAQSYLCDMAIVTITLIDSDLNTNPSAIESYDLLIYSDSEPSGEMVTVFEESEDSDTFNGTMTIDYGNAPGILQVTRGDLITVEYDDSDCVGSPATVEAHATAVCVFPEQAYFWDMGTNPGWTVQGQWAWGHPTGSSGDPSNGYTGTNVYGYNLSGSYSNNMAETFLTTTAIDCTDLENVEVRFMRWLGVESSQWDHASFRVSNNGSTWTTIWDHSGSSLTETSWSAQVFDISDAADNQPTLYLRWVMGTTDSSVVYCGWNIDDVEIWGENAAEPTPVPTETPNPCVNDGDVNNDGSITAGDAQMAFQIALGTLSPTPEQECSADCNGNSTVTAGDAQQIFMTALGTASCVDPL